MPTATLELAVAPQTTRFSNDREQDLDTALQEQADGTRTMSMTMPAQIMFNKSGKVQGSLQMSTTALSQLCSMLAPGLSLVVSNLCHDKNAPDPELAVKTINELVRLRFKSALESRRLVIDTRTNRIDGIVGPNYVQLSNSELYRRSKQYIGRAEIPAVFHEAVVTGRRMMVQYRSEKPLFTHIVLDDSEDGYNADDVWCGGYHFSNSEVGECAVRAAALVMRQICSNGAVGPVEEGGRLAHVKPENFEERFELLLERVQKKAHEVQLIRSNIHTLQDKKLELGGKGDEHAERCNKILKQLRKSGLSKKFGQRVIARTIVCSSNDIRPLSSYKGHRPTMKAVQSRNMYDLFNSLTFEAKTLPVSSREPAEQLAYRMLVGRFHLN